MSIVQTLWVVWQSPTNRLFYHVGTLSFFNAHYEFRYVKGNNDHLKLNDAIRNGYILSPAFPDPDKVYKSDQLFPAFNRRLPTPNRADFAEILKDLGLNEECTKMELLEETRGRLANDTYSFERPLRVEKDEKVHTSFYIHGMRHRELPSEWPTWLNVDSEVVLKRESDHSVDPNAVAIHTLSGKHIGYVPGFYANGVSALLDNGAIPLVKVKSINADSTPHWWVKVSFESDIPVPKEEIGYDFEAIIEIAS
ncbi:HIRAN domain-containing protein [Cytobacillus sp. S13-E01]|uniref:HIRAN domain-containing protein n=1 Tax=Cytobacillus sp. S13-E01 TaxID=3031326 RepID=UPI0023D7DA86|nr:HIRAN domain-containing protein [Cytobacillus sp. S13-E01]MDF0727152.1 HIRAN domain-containing protein [Cytobacillus sp. S13-E01]